VEAIAKTIVGSANGRGIHGWIASTLTPAKADVSNFTSLILEDSFDSPHFGGKETPAKPESARAQ
jgi:hypothetical protein